MFLGRPTNQWIGLITAAASLIQVLVVTLLPEIDPVNVAIVIGAVTTFLGVLVAFLAGQPPTLAPGDKFVTLTPPGNDNYVTTVAKPPAPSVPVPE